MNDDLAAFFDPADGFTVEASLEGGQPFHVHFDNAYAEVLGVSSSGPAATCRGADVQTARVGSSIEVAGSAYRVSAIEPDGAGVTLLRLVRA